MMSFRYCIMLSGAGGHGLIQAARMIAEAAAIYDNKNAAESCSYGPEARGSASRAEIIVSDEPIDYPRAPAIDFLMALTQQAFDQYVKDISPDGTAVVDSNVKSAFDFKGKRLLSVPLREIAETECDKAGLVNIVSLGYFAGVNEVISESAIKQAMLARVPKNSEQTYVKAYEAGLKAASGARHSK